MTGRAVLGLLLMLGLVLGGWTLGSQIKAIRLADRAVTVKGLVERTVKSDSASWPISFKEVGNDLPSIFARSESDKTAVLSFLASQGFSSAEITVDSMSVTDRATNGGNQEEARTNRFVLQQTVLVKTGDVDKVARASAQTADLIKAGVVLDSGGPTYKFNGLNALKPDMITEATRNARASADRFAADSGSQVGSIRSANQGVFSISSASGGSTTGDDNGYSFDQQADASIMKKVRVVSTIEYYLVK